MTDKLINIDSNLILKLSKAGLERSALELKSKFDPLTEYEFLYKFQYFVKYRMECIKDLAKETFIEKFEGSQTEKENGFSITLKNQYEYNYSDKVKNLESEIKLLQEQLKQIKEKERKKAQGESKNEILALTLY